MQLASFHGFCRLLCVKCVGSSGSCFLGNKTKSTDWSESTSTERKNETGLLYDPLDQSSYACPPCGFGSEKQSSHSTLAFSGSTQPASFHITRCWAGKLTLSKNHRGLAFHYRATWAKLPGVPEIKQFIFQLQTHVSAILKINKLLEYVALQSLTPQLLCDFHVIACN